jgi:hypothetical protein
MSNHDLYKPGTKPMQRKKKKLRQKNNSINGKIKSFSKTSGNASRAG